MKEASVRLRFVEVSICFVLCQLSNSTGLARQAASAQQAPAVPSSAPDHPSGESPGCPSPVLPASAFLLSEYANLELTITANRDGSLQKVVISKKSKARLYDEYTRKWVETHWKMPLAKPSEPDVRTFIAPIVYPKSKWPPGGRYPPPDYPVAYMQAHVEGLVVIELKVAPSGDIESVRTVLSSGHKGLDTYTEEWIRKRWKFPPGERRWLHCPVTYLMQ